MSLAALSLEDAAGERYTLGDLLGADHSSPVLPVKAYDPSIWDIEAPILPGYICRMESA